MDRANPFIVDSALPAALNIDLLKQQGIALLQSLAGQAWTNYNDSDPGVTILEQLCYALTELGYCADFPIEDVLTGADGTIRYEDQFFAAQDILTCSPITIDDYRRLVHDHEPQVRAIYLEAVSNCRYATRLALDDGAVDQETMIGRVSRLLERHRNLAERFMRPVLLRARPISLTGAVYLTASADQGEVRSQIIEALRQYEAPMVVRSGYSELGELGWPADQICNGPRMHNGWIAGAAALGEKCRSVSLFALTELMAGIDGVSFVDTLGFTDSAHAAIPIADEEIAAIALAGTFAIRQGASDGSAAPGASPGQSLAGLQAKHAAASVAAHVDAAPVLPIGQYRDIEQYYSIQNTFPDIYGIGQNSLQSDAPSYRVARARQLKGYLMVYDQLLANQFAQLAHVGDLFSFGSPPAAKPGPVPSPADQARWPLHQRFSTTYHCQPLYGVPDALPLLHGNEAFHYQLDPAQAEPLVQRDAWQRYLTFPFNQYIHGLHQIMESEDQALGRRDAMLSHLMARHGDDAADYHPMIKAFRWFGSELASRIVVKTIWLQNYQMLSYYRAKACDLQAADRLAPLPEPPVVPQALPNGRMHGDDPMRDGELDKEALFRRARLTETDFRNFSTFELKLDILLGVSAHLLALVDKLTALLAQPGFTAWLAERGRSRYALEGTDVWVECRDGEDKLFDGKEQLMDIKPAPDGSMKASYVLIACQLHWLATQRKGFLLLENVAVYSDDGRADGATLVFPECVALFQRAAFREALATLVELHWPAHVRWDWRLMPGLAMQQTIKYFIRLRQHGSAAAAAAAEVLSRLLQVAPAAKATHAS